VGLRYGASDKLTPRFSLNRQRRRPLQRIVGHPPCGRVRHPRLRVAPLRLARVNVGSRCSVVRTDGDTSPPEYVMLRGRSPPQAAPAGS
jgi:hypothetical protein